MLAFSVPFRPSEGGGIVIGEREKPRFSIQLTQEEHLVNSFLQGGVKGAFDLCVVWWANGRSVSGPEATLPFILCA